MRITIDNKPYEAKVGETILDVARREGVDIPYLCYHPDLSVKANCRQCVVEIAGARGPVTACSTPVAEEMEVTTNSPKIERLRKFNLELIFAQHNEECADCVLRQNCSLLKYLKQYNVKMCRFKDRKSERSVYQFGPIVFDQTKCIDCRNCVEVCPVAYLEVTGRGADIGIAPSSEICEKKKYADKKCASKECIYCGQCIVHCPVGAIEAAGEFEYVGKCLENKDDKIVVVQFAPSVRSSIGEMFGFPYGSVVTEKLTGALRQLGFDYVFDTSLGADITTVEEAAELVERVKCGGNLPMFTSCCPAWVNYVEYFRPDLIPNLTTVRSPQVILGGVLKTYWADIMKIDPKRIVTVSIMPCTAKKYEIKRPELHVNGLPPVDYVLTTRELGYLLQRNSIDLRKVKAEELDNPFGHPSGAGVIYGASGGVTESALRTAYFDLTKKDLDIVEFELVRGIEGIKRAEVEIPGMKRKLKVAVASSMKCAQHLLSELADKPNAYDYIEVMACPGGCIGGGGQPIPVDNEIRKKRAKALYEVDTAKVVRLAHRNPLVEQVYAEYLCDRKKAHAVCHTGYKKKKKGEITLLPDSLQTLE